jgi:chromate reductase, NAD(P)H dehydrogenase (quinone)
MRTDMAKLDILGISGSLRRSSFNTALLRTAIAVAPDDVAIEIYDHSDMPLYNGDVETSAFPAQATRLKERIARADGLLFTVPEYNYGMPGVLKNMIDWASRPYGQNAWHGKPTAIMGAGGGLGTARSQYQFRQTAFALQMRMVDRPEIFVANAAQKFDANGNLTDPVAKDLIKQLVAALAEMARSKK